MKSILLLLLSASSVFGAGLVGVPISGGGGSIRATNNPGTLGQGLITAGDGLTYYWGSPATAVTNINMIRGGNVPIVTNGSTWTFGDVETFTNPVVGSGQLSGNIAGGSNTFLAGTNIAYVSMNGNDSTAILGQPNFPYATVNSAVTNQTDGTLVMIGPGNFTNGSIRVPAGVNIQGSGRNVTFLWFTNSTPQYPGWIHLTNRNTISDFTMGSVSNIDILTLVYPITFANTLVSTNNLLMNLEVNGRSDMIALCNGAGGRAVNCKFRSNFDGVVDGVLNVSVNGNYLFEFFNCEFFATANAASVVASDNLDCVSSGSTNLFFNCGSMTISNIPAKGETAIIVNNSGPTLNSVRMQILQDSNPPNSGLVFFVNGAKVMGHPYEDYQSPGAIFLGDATNNIVNIFGVTNTAMAGWFMSVNNIGTRFWSKNAGAFTNLITTNLVGILQTNNVRGVPTVGFVPAIQSDGYLTWAASGSGSQTPWTSQIDGAGNQLVNAGNLYSTGTVQASSMILTGVPPQIKIGTPANGASNTISSVTGTNDIEFKVGQSSFDIFTLTNGNGVLQLLSPGSWVETGGTNYFAFLSVGAFNVLNYGNGFLITNIPSYNIIANTNPAGNGTVVNFALGNEVTTNTTGNISFASVSGLNPTNYNWQIIHVINDSASDKTITFAASWKTQGTCLLTNGTQKDILIEAQNLVYTNASWKSEY